MGIFDFLKPEDVSKEEEEQTKEDEPMKEMIKCKDCGKEMEENLLRLCLSQMKAH